MNRAGAARRALCPPEEVKSPEARTDTTLGNEPIVTFDFKQHGPSEIVVDGDRATVRYHGETVTRLRKVNGRRLIAG